jgi:hypothetical protein
MRDAYVRPGLPAAALPPPVAQVAVAVDTALVAGSGGSTISTGIYLMDNQLAEGATGEASFVLHSIVPVGSLIGFTAYPINTGIGDTVVITGFNIVEGDVFGSAGYPILQQSGYWIGQAMNIGAQSYQIQLCITAGSLRPTRYYVHAQASLSAR